MPFGPTSQVVSAHTNLTQICFGARKTELSYNKGYQCKKESVQNMRDKEEDAFQKLDFRAKLRGVFRSKTSYHFFDRVSDVATHGSQEFLNWVIGSSGECFTIK